MVRFHRTTLNCSSPRLRTVTQSVTQTKKNSVKSKLAEDVYRVCCRRSCRRRRKKPAGSDWAIWRLWPPPSPGALPHRGIRLPIPTLVVPELAAVGWPRRTSRLTHAKQLTPASTGDAVANCKGGASNELGVPHPPRRAERLALTTLTRLVRFNSTRQAYFQPPAAPPWKLSSLMRMRARSLSRASARPLGGEGSKATDRARGLGDSPDVLRAAQGCSHLRCQAAPGRARRRGAACSPPRGHCQCGGDRPGIGRASPWESGQCSRPPRARPLAEPREGRGIPCARWLLPTRGTRSTACTRGKCTVGHRPLLSTVQTTPCASRGARAGAAPRHRCRPPREAESPPHDTHHAPHPPQRSIEYSYNEFTNKTLHTRTALQVNHVLYRAWLRGVWGVSRDEIPAHACPRVRCEHAAMAISRAGRRTHRSRSSDARGGLRQRAAAPPPRAAHWVRPPGGKQATAVAHTVGERPRLRHARRRIQAIADRRRRAGQPPARRQ